MNLMNIQKIIEYYNEALSRYINEVNPQFQKYLDDSGARYMSTLNRLYEFYVFTSYLVEEDIILPDNKDNPIMVLYSKAALSLFGIYNCLKNGLATESATLLRSLFETLINVELLLQKDTEERLKLYTNFKYITQWNQLQENKDLLNEGLIDEARFRAKTASANIPEVEKKYLELKDDYHPTKPYHWAWLLFRKKKKDRNPSLRMICKELGYFNEYIGIYGPMSISVHSNPLIEHLVTNENSITMAPIFSNHIVSIGCMSLDYCAKVVISILQFFDIEKIKDIKIFIDAFVLDTLLESGNIKP